MKHQASHSRSRTRVILMAGLLAALPLLAAPTIGTAQEPGGLSFVGGIAYEGGGPGPSLVDALTAAGLDHPRHQQCVPGGQCGSTEHPFHFTEGLSIAGMVGARYRFRGPFSLEVLASNGQRGHAEGYNQNSMEHLVVAHSSFLLTSTLGLHLGPLRLAGGPSLMTTFWDVTHNSKGDRKATVSSVGATLALSAGVRAAETLLSFRAGARAFPTTDLSVAVQTPIASTYRSFYVGVAVLPWLD